MKKLCLIVSLAFSCFAQTSPYHWLPDEQTINEKVRDIACLSGYIRVKADSNSFSYWLRNLPLKNESEQVRLFDNRLKPNQSAHYRIVNIDVGKKDLQQCADAIIRLRAEYLYYSKDYNQINFNFTSGDSAKFTDWMKGLRPLVINNRVNWKNTGTPGRDYSIFKKYLETIFIYAGSYSLKKELAYVANINEIKIGDVFIQDGFPGHAIIIIDQCTNPQTGKIAILLAQSYMPAQDIHILKNLNNDKTNPWYIISEENELYTPEWSFKWKDLYRFK